MKGYFGIGVEGISKAVNVGTLFRTAHAFGAYIPAWQSKLGKVTKAAGLKDKT